MSESKTITLSLTEKQVAFLLTLLKTPSMGFRLEDCGTVSALHTQLENAAKNLAGDAPG